MDVPARCQHGSQTTRYLDGHTLYLCNECGMYVGIVLAKTPMCHILAGESIDPGSHKRLRELSTARLTWLETESGNPEMAHKCRVLIRYRRNTEWIREQQRRKREEKAILKSQAKAQRAS
jgi:hypothetical protein